ncbi:hypothetical protein [Schumannella sp. 10F1B-5-1]|nr:hypothetical protein [Schumannella sp. 10F1B-5-1]
MALHPDEGNEELPGRRLGARRAFLNAARELIDLAARLWDAAS